jgi:hypothetical protein
MPTLKVLGTDRVIGDITAAQLQFLIDHLEEEHEHDKDYFLDQDTIELLAERGCDQQLLDLLRGALGDAEELDIVWSD